MHIRPKVSQHSIILTQYIALTGMHYPGIKKEWGFSVKFAQIRLARLFIGFPGIMGKRVNKISIPG